MKTLTKILLGIVGALALIPSVAFATPTAVNRLNNDHIEPLISTDFIKVLSNKASIFPYASSTAVSAPTFCIGTDCRTVWPTSGGGAFPFITNTNFNQTSNATTTALWLQASPYSLMASSTSIFDYASSTASTANTLFSNQGIFSGGPWQDARACGAKADGSTDDSGVINTCIVNLANAGGGTLYLSAAPGRAATTKYEFCGTPITMKSYTDVVVQTGVGIENCNGNATSTVQFISGPNGTFFSHWTGGIFTEKGTPQKLWTAFNIESENVNGGVFWDSVSNVNIYFPGTCIRNAEVGSANGWLNSNTYKDIVCNNPTHGFTFSDGGSKGTLGISSTKFDNVQLQANVSTEDCFTNVMHNWTTIENARCYDMNATSTSLSIDGSAIGTTIIGGYATERNFVNNGNRTNIIGDPLYPLFASSTLGSIFVNTNGQTLFGTTSAAWAGNMVAIANGSLKLGQSNSSFNSPLILHNEGNGEWQEEYIKAATSSGGNPNSGNIIISAREGVLVNTDSDNTSNVGSLRVRSNRSDGGITTTNEYFSVIEGPLVGIGSTTPAEALGVRGNIFANNLLATNIFATGTVASVLPYASTTALTVSGTSYLGTVGSGVLTGATGLPLTSGVTGILPTANGGTNASSFTTTGNGVSWDGTRLITAPLTSPVTYPYASTTMISASTASSSIFIADWGNTSSPSITFNGETNTGIYHAVGTNQFSFGTAGQNRMTISGAGIAVTGNTNISGVAVSSSVTASNIFPYASTTALSASSLIDSTNFLAFGSTTLQNFTAVNATTTNATTTSLYASGFVSIGSTSPFALLSVNPTAGIAPNEFVVGSSSATAMLIDNTGNTNLGGMIIGNPERLNVISGNINLGAQNGRLYFYKTASTDASNDYCTTATGNSGTFGCDARQSIVFNINSDALGTGNFLAIRKLKTAIDTLTTSELIRFQESGEVGIGTSTPKGLLHLATTTGNTGFLPQLYITDMGAALNQKQWSISNERGTLIFGTSTDAFATSTPALQISTTGTTTLNSTYISGGQVASSTEYIYSKKPGFGGQQIFEAEGGGVCIQVSYQPNATQRTAIVTCPPEI